MEKDLWGNARRYQGKQGDAEVDKTRTLKEALKNRLASYFEPEVVSSFGNEIAFLKTFLICQATCVPVYQGDHTCNRGR